MTDPTPEVVEVTDAPVSVITINGREIVIKSPNESQILQVIHEASIFQDESGRISQDRKFKSLDRFFRVLVSMVVKEEDREFVEDEIADGLLSAMIIMEQFKGAINKRKIEPTVRRAPRATRRN